MKSGITVRYKKLSSSFEFRENSTLARKCAFALFTKIVCPVCIKFGAGNSHVNIVIEFS
jgi:hypothetical protein